MSHRDATLFSSDVASLAAPNFLLDGVINFVMAHMTTKLGDESLLLVSPSVASLLANLQDYEPEAVADAAQALLLASRRMVLFPVNNSERLDKADDGSHWSLLVLDNITGRFVHHDSMDGANLPAATRLADALRSRAMGTIAASTCWQLPWPSAGGGRSIQGQKKRRPAGLSR